MSSFKKNIDEQDNIQVFLANLRSHIERNKKIVITSSIITGALILILGSGYLYFLRYDKMASRAYSAIFETNLKKPNTSEITKLKIKEYSELVSNYPYSSVANISYFRLGNLYLSLGEIDAAIDNLTRALNRSGAESELYTLSLIALGECFESKKDFRKSLELYDKAKKSHKGHLFEGIIFTNMGRSYENINEFKESKDLYGKAMDKISDKFMKIYFSRKISLQG